MSSYKYATQVAEEKQFAKAVVLSSKISWKQGIEIANWLRKRPVKKAEHLLERVIALEQAVPFRRFNDNVGHKSGMAAGRYPKKAAEVFLKLLKQASANASVKNLDEQQLIIHAIVVNRATSNPRYGRFRGRIAKNAHVEIWVTGPASKKKADKKAKKDVSSVVAEQVEEQKVEQKTEKKVNKPQVKQSEQKVTQSVEQEKKATTKVNDQKVENQVPKKTKVSKEGSEQ
ncbi:MAG: 50S ribosomal protein L22 [Candidatus Woesearchaeota archaeon]